MAAPSPRNMHPTHWLISTQITTKPRPWDSPTRSTLGALSDSTSVNGSKSKRGLYRHWYQISTSPDTFWVFLSSWKSNKHHFLQAG
jgi:hypothetical protein